MAEELNESLEYTPTWIVAVVCSIIVAISFLVERGIHHFGKYLAGRNDALYRAIEKLKEGAISHICIPPKLATHMLPCKRHPESTTGSEHDLIYYSTISNRRRLFSDDETSSASKHCTQKGKVPLMSLESLHHSAYFHFCIGCCACGTLCIHNAPWNIKLLIVQVLCSYSTLPLYALVTQMGSRLKLKESVESSLLSWHEGSKSRAAAGDSSASGTSRSHRMVKEPTQQQHQHVLPQESSLELACTVEASSKQPYAVN